MLELGAVFWGLLLLFLIGSGKALADELVVFQLVYNGYAEVFYREAAFAFGIEYGLIGAYAEFAGAPVFNAMVHQDGRTEECPVESVFLFQDVEVIAGGGSAGFVFGGKLGCIYQLNTGCNL